MVCYVGKMPAIVDLKLSEAAPEHQAGCKHDGLAEPMILFLVLEAAPEYRVVRGTTGSQSRCVIR